MKSMNPLSSLSLLLSKRATQMLAALVLLWGGVGQAEAGILYYVDGNDSTDNMAGALSALSGTYTTTIATSQTDFAAKIATGNYDLGIFSAQYSYDPSYSTALSALATSVSAGRKAIVSSWYHWTSTDITPFGAAFTGSANESTVSVTLPAFAAGFEGPVGLSGYGIFSTGLNGSSVAATFGSGQAAIVVGNGGRSIVNGFLNDTASNGPQGVQLYVNEINYLEGGTASVPEPCTLAIWSLLGVCGMGFGWRRRKQTA